MMTELDEVAVTALRNELCDRLFHSTFMGGIRSTRYINRAYQKGHVDSLIAYDRLLTKHNDPKPITAVIELLHENNMRYLLPLLTEAHVDEHLRLEDTYFSYYLLSAKRIGEGETRNERSVTALALSDLSRAPLIHDIILDRKIIEYHRIQEILDVMTDSPVALSEGAL